MKAAKTKKSPSISRSNYRIEALEAGDHYDPVKKMKSKADQLKEDISQMEALEETSDDDRGAKDKGRSRSPPVVRPGQRPMSAMKGSRSPSEGGARRNRVLVAGPGGPVTPKTPKSRVDEMVLGGGPRMTPDTLMRGRKSGSIGRGTSPSKVPSGRSREAAESEEVAALHVEMASRQESYLRREEAYRAEIQELKDSYDKLAGSKRPPFDETKSGKEIRGMHQELMHGLDLLGERPKKDDSHQSLVASLKERLYAAEAQARSAKKENSAEEWMQRCAQLRGELVALQEHTHRLDRLYKTAQADKERLQQQYRCQEDDREFLVRQLVAVKKENARLRTELMRIREDLVVGGGGEGNRQAVALAAEDSEASNVGGGGGGGAGKAGGGAGGGGAGGAAGGGGNERDITEMVRAGEGAEARVQRFEEVIAKQRKMLERERMLTRKARADHMEAVQGRTELQMLLRECVDDVRRSRAEVASQPHDGRHTPKSSAREVASSPLPSRRRPASAAPGSPSRRGLRNAGADPASGPLTPEERERVLEALLAKERVLTILFDKTFTGLVPAGAVQAAQQALEPKAAARSLGLGAGAPALVRRPSFRHQAAGEADGAGGAGGPSPWALNVDHMLFEFMGQGTK